ncbi:hypothetical protein LAZ67_11002942 [Cordylochernes scorpioides]|uniref:RNA-directed DNA polymerase n=1 Tax=Cordylochernes scorpioides TaxID=51811 RepID=A0ABY6KZJ2_9ARAC|nr:hypothetical protein LAZ67_11002942 [Cordylochernes scorpioides]
MKQNVYFVPSERVVCPDHKDATIVQCNDGLVCPECGVVVESLVIDDSPEWRNFEDGPDHSRVTFEDTETYFDFSDEVDRSYKEKTLKKSLKKIENCGYSLEVSSIVIIKAKTLFTDVYVNHTEKLSVLKLTSASIWAACLIHREPVIWSELETITQVKKDRTEKYAERFFGNIMPPLRLSDLVERYCRELKVPYKFIVKAAKVIDKIQNRVLGPKPKTLIAAALYVASKKELSLEILAEHFDIVPGTIMKMMKLIQAEFKKSRNEIVTERLSRQDKDIMELNQDSIGVKSDDPTKTTEERQEVRETGETTAPLADVVTQLSTLLTRAKVSDGAEATIPPFDGTYSAIQFFQAFDRKMEDASMGEQEKLLRLPNYLVRQPLELFRKLRLADRSYFQVRQILLDLYPESSEASFAKYFAMKLTGQANLETYYREKTAMGLQLGLPQEVILETLTEGLPFNDQRLVRVVPPENLGEWFRLVQRIHGPSVPTTRPREDQPPTMSGPYHSTPRRPGAWNAPLPPSNSKVRKCDLSKLAYELGEVVPPESRIVDLKRLILNSQSYEEEFAKQLLETLIEEREQTAQTEQAERIERERKEQMVMEFELEKLRIQTTRGNNDTSRSTSNDAHYEIRKLMPKYESKDNDLSFYLILFERQAKRLGLDEDQWAFSLLGLLPYEMTQLIARETEEQSGDYRFVKRLLLKRYKLSPEQFRQKFEKHERSQKGSWRDFAFELRGYFNEWIEGMNVENFDALKDLSVTNQLKKKVPNVLRNHLIDDWTKLNNPDELADKLDEYENVRTEMGPPHWNAKHLIPPSFQQKSARFPNQSEVKETKQGTNVSGQDAARNEISETYPNTLRRMVNRTIRNDKGEPKCFNCNQFGHIARDCSAPRTTLTCRGCGQTGHKERNCTRPKEGLKVANLEVEGLETVTPDVYLKDVKIDNKETVKAMIDTGSSSCLMRESVARRISVDIEPDSTSLYGIGNQTAPAARTVGKTTVDLEIDGIVGREITVFIVNDDAQPYDLLIGRTWTDLPYVSFARIGKELHIGYSSEFPFTNLQEEIKSRRIELRATETVQLESDSINFTSAITDEVKDGYVLFTGVDDACVDSLLEVVDGKTTVPIISAGKGKLRVRKNQCVGRVELLNLDDIVVNLDVAEDSFQTKNEEKREGQDQMKRKRPILPEDINVNHSLTSKERQEILDVVNEYRDCFALGMEELGCTDVTKMDIKEVDGSKPVCLRPYKTTASEREAIREIVREWKDNGIVTETRSPYASPVLLVRKKTGDHRLVVDYRRLNIQTVKDKFPLPRIDDLLEGLRNAKFFTTLDLAHGYLQIPLTDKAKLKTAFITPDDTGQFERMIFGLANAPAEFQRLMHTVLGPLLNKKAFCYLDDVIIPAKDWREMIERLREVLERIRSAKLTLKPSKCEFGRREVEFLGYVISTGGLKPGPRKIKAIEEFPEPKNVHDIRRFLGLTNFFRRFVKDFARKAEPLSRLTKKGSQFEWKEEQRRSFGGLRKDLVEYPVLAHYNPELKTEVHCDASAEGLAGMVLQMDEDGKWRLVYCVSKKTTEAEKMYHSSKLELMAIVWTLDRLRQFLVGIKFTVVTDCQALVYMNAKKTTNPQIARWYNLIQEYDFEIRHKPGEKMAHVDGMSRAPVDDPRDTMEEIVEKNLEVCLTITPEEQILMIQHSDPELRDLIQIFRKDPCDRTVGEQNRINDYSYRRKSGRGARSRRYPPTQPTTFLQRKVQSRTIEIQEWPNVGAIPTREPQINRL